MKIAILGGTFNPPHFGHLFFANEVRQKFGFDKIIFVPTYISPHKQYSILSSSKDRLEMLKLATKDIPWALVSDCDIKRGVITRTVDTIDDINKLYNLTDKPSFIIGDDLAPTFHLWKNPKELVEKANIIIGVRENLSFDFKYSHSLIKNRVFPLSSSEIRERVSSGLDIDFLLPKEVIEYIRENGLYRSNSKD
ncbi:nicotinate (nicotinamide) nucleotide adenylyltransferase [Thiospirochaeta perfilievii]|uniref:Probable nicotinate-nucleotide adenylyltransferase n=1 Tax=Thiospirochaeta perfilievii TaxID=252967 RepID=A0A5C1QFL9_9SPIO|nr:nicotinate (nicotinamide) nucleotide adenylyltransferase [Thiospirochaeta perfilievii]QEN06207.1 nicotinate (nicotinamide) nucleotide adenylyltransferase [Thiospirochaeta perfilievii]